MRSRSAVAQKLTDKAAYRVVTEEELVARAIPLVREQVRANLTKQEHNEGYLIRY